MNDDRKLRVALTQGDANGVGLEMIFKTFLDGEMLELCTPIIYGSPKVASYHNKALNLHNQFSIINRVDDARDNRVNLLVCTDEEIRVEFGKHSDAATRVEVVSLQRAVADCQTGAVDALVCGATDNNILDYDGVATSVNALTWRILDPTGTSLRLSQTPSLRVTYAHAGALKDVMTAMDSPLLTAQLTAVAQTLRRDYRLEGPRIAVLALDLNDTTVEETVLAPVVQQLSAEGHLVFGPYRSDRFFPSGDYRAFDLIFAMYYEQALLPLYMLSAEERVVVQSNLPFVCTLLPCGAQMAIAGKGRADEQPLRQAIYAALDMCRARQDYDAAHASPLPKLYKEHSDSGERQ